MANIWDMWAYRSPHQLEDTEPLPKFRGMLCRPSCRAMPSGNILEDLLAEDEDLDPVLGHRKVRQNDIWNFKVADKGVDTLLTEVSEFDIMDETAMAASNLAQAAVQALPLMVLEGQLYCQWETTWEPMGKREFVLASQEDPRMQAALRGFNGRGLSDLYERVTLQPPIQRDVEDVQMPPSLIPCRDGVFDLDKMRPRKVRADDYFFSACDVSVDEIGEGDGNQFEAFMDSVAEGNAAIRQQVLEMIGAVISGYRPKNFFLLIGPPDTGKSQVMNLLRTLIGSQHTMSLSEPNQLAAPFISGSLIGKRLCYCPDVARVNLSQKSAAMLKQLTGGDLIQANVKYKQPFTFVNEGTVIFVSNFPLQLPYDPALESRLVTIPFNRPIPKERQIPNFSRMLCKERGYIVGEAIGALQNLVERGFQFTRMDSVVQLPAKKFGGSALDQVVRFVEARCQFDPDGKEYNDALYQSFCEFSDKDGGILLSREALFLNLNAAFQQLEPFRTSRQRGYKGIRLLPHPCTNGS